MCDDSPTEDPRPPGSRNLIACSDGTGNAGGKSRGTNVWRIFNAVENRDAPVEQIAFYDDGVGTEDWKPARLLGGAFGWGFTRNLIDLYSFLALNYRSGDRIYLFGFSRGAFTVRTLAGIITKCGMLDREHLLDERDPGKVVRQLVRAYRRLAAGFTDASLAALQKRYPELTQPVQIEVVGVFDTVDAVGVPIAELRRPLDWLTRQVFRRRLYGFSDRILSPQVRCGCQALSIDDERKTFHPNVWEDGARPAVQSPQGPRHLLPLRSPHRSRARGDSPQRLRADPARHRSL
jgi:uncharacterized protein (DUF2235 family)